jgi:hypothetical protein
MPAINSTAARNPVTILINNPRPERRPRSVARRANQNNDSVLPDRFFVQIIARASLKLKTSVASGMQSAFRRPIVEQKLKLKNAAGESP